MIGYILFILKLKKSTEFFIKLSAEELLEVENYLQNERKKFYKDRFESLINGKSVEKKSPRFNFVSFIDETEVICLVGRIEFGDLSIDKKHSIDKNNFLYLPLLILRRELERMT